MPVEPVDAATPQAILAAESTDDPHALAALAKSSKFSVRYAVVRNPNCPVEVLEACLDDLEATIHMGIAANPNTPVALLREIAADEDQLFACQIHLLGNPDTPSDVLERLICVAHEPKVLMDAARHPNASTQLLNNLIELSGDGNLHVRKAAAGVMSLPVLDIASRDVNDVVRRFQAVNWIEPAGLLAILNGAVAALDTRTFEIVLVFWRRRKYPTKPRALQVVAGGDDIQFTWTEPRRPKKLDRYSIEGLQGERWLLVHEHMGTTTHATHLAGGIAVTQWRVTATNHHGTSKPSDEVAVAAAGPSDKRPGPPIDFTISTDGPLSHLTWSAPTTGGPPEKYVLEGRRGGKWQEVLDFDADNTRAAVPASEVEGAETWRLRAANDHGIGKPSDEVGVLEVESDPGPGEGSIDEEPESDGA